MAKRKKEPVDEPAIEAEITVEEATVEAPEPVSEPESMPEGMVVIADATKYVAEAHVTCRRCGTHGVHKMAKGEAVPKDCLAPDCHAVEPEVSITVRKL